MTFSLFALWWRRLRGLRKLPDGRDWLRGHLGLVLMGWTMLSKSLIQFSVDGQDCVPSLLFYLSPNYDGDSEDNVDLLLNAPCCLQCSKPAAGHLQPTPLSETPGHSWASLSPSLLGSLLLSPGSYCTQGSVCALTESVSPVLCKFWQLCDGVNGDLPQESLCHTQVCCIQSPCPCGRPLLTHIFAGNTQTQSWLNRWVLVHTGCAWALWASLGGKGFDSKCDFTPPTVSLGCLLCRWTWGIFFWLIVFSLIQV